MIVTHETPDTACTAWKKLDYRCYSSGMITISDPATVTSQNDRYGSPVVGTTQFMRYPAFLSRLAEHINTADKPMRVLVVPGSVGCEAYTLAMLLHNLSDGKTQASIDTFDMSPSFSDIAENGLYPSLVLRALAPDLQRHFALATDEKFAVLDEQIRQAVNVLPPQNVFDFQAEQPYDAVICSNLIQYLSPALIEKLFSHLTDMVAQDGVLCVDKAIDLYHNYCGGKSTYDIHQDLKAKSFTLCDTDFQRLDTDRALPESRTDMAICLQMNSYSVMRCDKDT